MIFTEGREAKNNNIFPISSRTQFININNENVNSTHVLPTHFISLGGCGAVIFATLIFTGCTPKPRVYY
jgi:hypothetical protein